MDPLNKIKFVEEDGSSVVLDVPMTARGERKEVLPIDKMEEIGEDVEDEIKNTEEKMEEVVSTIENEIKNTEEKAEEVVSTIENEIKNVEENAKEELQEINALVNDIKEQGIKDVAATIENIEIKIKPPKGCCIIQ